jgi:elongation factor Tu
MRLSDCHGYADYVKEHDHRRAQMDGAILVVSAADGPDAADRASTSCWRARSGVPYIVVFLNKVDVVDDPGASRIWSSSRCASFSRSIQFPGDKCRSSAGGRSRRSTARRAERRTRRS